jgi:hypothetical protein
VRILERTLPTQFDLLNASARAAQRIAETRPRYPLDTHLLDAGCRGPPLGINSSILPIRVSRGRGRYALQLVFCVLS